MTARDLQVGDVCVSERRACYEVVCVDGHEPVVIPAWRGGLPIRIMCGVQWSEVHRPQPDGTLKQVFPGVE